MPFLRVPVAMVLLGLGAGMAQAQQSQPLRDVSPDGGDACFGRIYDAAHLAKNPGQKIERIFFYYGQDPVSHPNEEPVRSLAGYDGFLTTSERGAKKPQWVGGWCGRADRAKLYSEIHCGMECDRALATLQLDSGGRLMLSGLQRDVYLDMADEEELGKAEYERRSLGTGDDNFRMNRMPVETCRAEFARIDPVDPALGAPLRERLKPGQPFCYGRDYTAQHMESHARQITTSIRVSRGAAQLAAYAAKEDPQEWPNNAGIKVTVTSTSKSHAASQDYVCTGEGDQWRCAAVAGAGQACDVSDREIFLRRGVNGTMMLANPNGGLPIVDLCSPQGGAATQSDDRVYRLSAMPQAFCGN